MFYIEEEKRGFFPEEDLFIPGRYEIEIKPEETIHSITVFIHDTNSNMISHSYWSNRQNQIKETITFITNYI